MKLIERRAAIVDAIYRCRQMGCPVTHDLRSETGLRKTLIFLFFYFGWSLLETREAELKKGGGESDHPKIQA